MFITPETLKNNLPAKLIDDLQNQYPDALARIVQQINNQISRITGLLESDANETTLADLELYGSHLFEYYTAPFRTGITHEFHRELRQKYHDAVNSLREINAPAGSAQPASIIRTTAKPRLGEML